jgi:hypothetical protein
MTAQTGPFRYPESLEAYFENAEVRFPVDQLLAKKMSFVPQVFTSGEVTDFYKACLAARQTQVDYAQTLFDLWHRIWPGLGADWEPAPYDPGDKELTLDPQVRWEQQYFQRSFDLKGKRLRANLWLFLTPSSPSGSEIELGCTLVQGSKWLLKKGSMPDGWSWDKDNEGFQFSADVVVAADGLDLVPFAEAARSAVSFIEDFVRP